MTNWSGTTCRPCFQQLIFGHLHLTLSILEKFSTGLRSLLIYKCRIRATISRFYMTTQTSLSAATRAQRDESVRNPSFQTPAPSFQKLTANLELEFRLTHRKISLLKISNRKFFAVFHLTAQLCRRPSSSSLPASSLEGKGFRAFCVPTAPSGICVRCTPVASSGPSISNPGHRPTPLACPESRRAQPHPRNRFAALIQFLRATDRGSRATEILIDGSAIRIRSNPFKNSNLKISNRR